MSARDRGNQGTNLMDDRLKLRMDHQMAHPIIEVFPGEAWQETEAYYRKFSCKTCYQKKPPKTHQKNETKNVSNMQIVQMKIAMNTQMHAEFKWRYPKCWSEKRSYIKNFPKLLEITVFLNRNQEAKKGKPASFGQEYNYLRTDDYLYTK